MASYPSDPCFHSSLGVALLIRSKTPQKARILTDFVNSLPEGQVEIAMTPKPLGIQLTCGRFECRILGTDAEEFPPIPSVEDGVGITIDPKVLRSAIDQVVFAAATEDSRPVLTGVKIEAEESNVTFAAADGFRLAVHTASLASPVAEPTSFIIPSRTLRELERLLADQDEVVEFTVTPQKSQAMFKLKNVELVSPNHLQRHYGVGRRPRAD